ncbi:MAG: cytochrome C, partial [Acidobacteriaceae bacterium]|nr:cytochrome C [Acidobacteriaceae bacterium]
CLGCHSIHEAKTDDHLLKMPQPLLCYSCHSDVKPAFSQPFHHKVNEGLMTCSDCHNPHGTFQGKALRTTADQNDICTKCHLETAGPFVYEHPVVKQEGCLSCHTPHGSANPRLMNVASVNQLCLRCHSTTNPAGVPSAKQPQGPNHSLTGVYVSCTTCHAQIHGSNAADNFFK